MSIMYRIGLIKNSNNKKVNILSYLGPTIPSLTVPGWLVIPSAIPGWLAIPSITPSIRRLK